MENKLIDDFEHEGKKTAIGCHWFYYADPPDKGNSVINGVKDTVISGNYQFEDFEPCSSCTAYIGKKCAKLDFALGDTAPQKLYGDNFNYTAIIDNYVGMGIDPTQAGALADSLFVNSLGIDFYARATDTFVVFCILRTKYIGNYRNYGQFYIVTPAWTHFSVRFDNPYFRRLPCAQWDGDCDSIPFNPRDIERINFQIMTLNVLKCRCSYFGCESSYSFSESDGNTRQLKTKGIFYLDEVTIAYIPSTSTVSGPRHHYLNPAPGAGNSQRGLFPAGKLFDIRGRVVNSSNTRMSITSGIFITEPPAGEKTFEIIKTGNLGTK